MTISVENIQWLIENELIRRRTEHSEIEKENEELELKLERNKERLLKISYHIDKTSKLAETIKMDAGRDKTFKEIHERK